MAAYWHFIDDVWVNTPEYAGCGFGYLRRWTPERLTEARALDGRGQAAAQTDAEKERVALADESLALFEQFMKMRRDQAEGRFAPGHGRRDLARRRSPLRRALQGSAAPSPKTGYAPKTPSAQSTSTQFYEQTYEDASRVAKDFDVVDHAAAAALEVSARQGQEGRGRRLVQPDFDDADWKTTDVCVDTWSALGLHNYMGSLWYRTQVKLPAVPRARRSTCGSARPTAASRCSSTASTSVRRAKKEKTDSFTGYCQPASFDVTAAIKPGAENQISLFCTREFLNELGTGGLLAPVVIYREK